MTASPRIPLSILVLTTLLVMALLLVVLFISMSASAWTSISIAAAGIVVVGISSITLFWVVHRLEVSEARLNTIFESAGDGLITTDEKGYIEKVNTSTVAIFGYRPGEMIGCKLGMLFSSAYQEDESEQLSGFLKKNHLDTAGAAYEVIGLRRDGRTFPMDFSVNSAYLDDRLVYVAIVRDVTERAEARHALEQARSELETRVRERTADLQRTNEKLHAEIAMRKRSQAEREKLIEELQDALRKIKTLKGLIPICASCKKIRDDSGYWNQIEVYIRDHSDAEFSHGICPECSARLYPELSGGAEQI